MNTDDFQIQSEIIVLFLLCFLSNFLHPFQTSAEFVAQMNGYKQDVTKKVCGKFQAPLNVELSDLP